jgi:hypothetical protein
MFSVFLHQAAFPEFLLPFKPTSQRPNPLGKGGGANSLARRGDGRVAGVETIMTYDDTCKKEHMEVS